MSVFGERLSGKQKSCFPYALSYRAFEIVRIDLESIGEQTKMTHISVYSWVKRFESEAMYARKDMCHTAGNPEEKMSLSLPKNSSG